MSDTEFVSTLAKIGQQISQTDFVIIKQQYNPESFGNYYIDISNEKFTYRLIKDRSQYFLVAKEARDTDWQEINKFVVTNFERSTLAFDMSIHKIGTSDLSLETILKLLPKLLLVSANS